MYTADQGFGWGQHGFRMKLAPYDATIRCPLIIRLPGVAAEGAVCRHPVSGVDLPATFFGVAGLPLPWKMHGHDLRPLLKQPDADWPHAALQTLTGRSYGADTDRVPNDPELNQLNGIPWGTAVPGIGRSLYAGARVTF